MSQTTEHYQLANTSASSPSHNNNNKRLLSHQHFPPNSLDFNTPSTIVNIAQTDSSLPQSLTSPIVNDAYTNGKNGVRNSSATMKIKDDTSANCGHFKDKYAFTLDLTPPVVKTKKDHSRSTKPQHYPFEMANNPDEDLHSPFELDVPLCENPSLKKVQNDFLIDRMLKDDSNTSYALQHRSSNQPSYANVISQPSPLMTPSSDHHDIDALSDAGTYIIEDDIDIAHDDEPEQDLAQPNDTQGDESLVSTSPPTSFRRYAATKKNRHGTFDIQGASSKTSLPVNRPIVDLSVPTEDLASPSASSSASRSSSSSSSLLSLPTENETNTCKEPEGASHHFSADDKSVTGLIYARQRPTTLSQQTVSAPAVPPPPQKPIKPAECFVISPTFETKPFPNSTPSTQRRRPDTQSKPKLTASTVPTKDTNFEIPSKTSPSSPPHSARSNQSDTERFSFRLQQHARQQDIRQQVLSSSNVKSDYVSTSTKSAVRPHTIVNDQTMSSPFQRNSITRQTMPANIQYSRPVAASSSTAAAKVVDDGDEVLSSHPSLTKVYMNKSFALRRQRSNLVPAAAKPVQQQQQQQQQYQQQQTTSKQPAARSQVKPVASFPATSLSISNSTGQTNRAVELRRQRAQAKIEELAQRTRQQLHKNEQHNDVMSASWHSNASSSSKKDYLNLRPNIRPTPNNSNNNNNGSSQKQDLLTTRTISSASSHHRSSSASPNPLGETTPRPARHRKAMVSSVTDESEFKKMNGSAYSEGERCDSLRDDGQRLAIKLIQLSSGILAKLKPNNNIGDNDTNVRELEQLVNQLQTVNRTLSSIDASLTGSTSDENLI